MKKFRSFLWVILIVMGFFIYNSQNIAPTTVQQNCKVYFVDRQLHRLVPIPVTSEKNIKKTADKIVDEIISGRDANPEILRIIPNIEDCISVDVSGEIAYVDISGDLIKKVNKSRDAETLFVYQIVNSLVSVDGINYVTFTINGNVEKDFLGYLDMRELFTADYSI